MRIIASEMEEVEKRNGSTAFFSAGSPSGRHKSGDVTNAVNVLACLQYGLFLSEPSQSVLCCVSPHLHISKIRCEK